MATTSEILTSLRERVRTIETAARPSTRCCSLGCPALDRVAPDGGLLAGTIHEWFAAGASDAGAGDAGAGGGSGAELLSLLAAREACREGGSLVILDPERDFYPPAAARWGLDLSRAIILRGGKTATELAWGIDQALQTSSVAAVWGPVGNLDERWLRRFQLSAEQSGCIGLFLRPATELHRPSWCEARWLCRSRPSLLPRGAPPDRLLQVDLIRARGGRAGLSVELRLDFEQGTISGEPRHAQAISLPLARQLAHPTTRRRAARA